jgi:hypothetical protein
MSKTLVSAGAALLFPIGMAFADNPPEVKEGLWSVHSQTIQNPGNKKSDQSSTICRNHAFDQYMLARTKNIKGCTVRESSQGGKRTAETHCLVERTVVDSKGTTTFQGDTAIHSESHATYAPPLEGVGEVITIQDQKYVGGCPAGVQPGDITLPNGKVNHSWKQ